MLDSITLLLAVGEIREDKVLDTIRALHLLDNQPQQLHKNRKMWRIVLIAAIIAALLTACAVGYSIHQRRQQELRAAHEVEAKHVDAWVDYEVPGFAAAVPTEPTLTLLSTYNDGVFCWAFVNVSPVEDEEAVTSVDQEALENGWVHWLSYHFTLEGDESLYFAHPVWNGKGEYGPEDLISDELVNADGRLIPRVTREAQHREVKKQCYDPASKTMTLKCAILLEWVDPDKPITLELSLWDHRQHSEKHAVNDYDIQTQDELRRSFGAVTFNIPAPQFCTIRFDNPPVFANDERGKTGRVLGADISATQIVWHLTHEEQEDESFEASLSWGKCIDELLLGATLNFVDGTSLNCGRVVASPLVNGELEAVSYHTAEGIGQTVIDVHDLVSVTVAGKTFPVPPVVDSQN